MKLGEVGRRKLEPPIKEGMLTDMPDGLKIVYGENVHRELTKLRMYESKCLPHGNMLTNECWGKWRKVQLHVRKYAIPNNGGIKLAGSKESPKGNMYS